MKEHSDGASKVRLHIETPSYSWSEGKEEVPRRIVICGPHPDWKLGNLSIRFGGFFRCLESCFDDCSNVPVDGSSV